MTSCAKKPNLVSIDLRQEPILDVGAVEVDAAGCDTSEPHDKDFDIDIGVTYTPDSADKPVAASYTTSGSQSFSVARRLNTIGPDDLLLGMNFSPNVTGPIFAVFELNITDAAVGTQGNMKLPLVGRGTCKGDDTDGDGLRDRVEDPNQNGIVDPGETDPNDPDSDDDKLFDGIEDDNKNGVLDDGETDPNNDDTDGDTKKDGDEDTNRDGNLDDGESDPRDPDS